MANVRIYAGSLSPPASPGASNTYDSTTYDSTTYDSTTYEQILSTLQSPSHARQENVTKSTTAKFQGTGSLKRKFEDIQEVVEAASQVRRILVNHESTKIRMWGRKVLGNGEELLQESIVDFLNELRDLTAWCGMELGSVSVTCPVCCGLYTDQRPGMKIVGCTHILCRDCHGELVRVRAGKGTRCPVCQKGFDKAEKVTT